MDGQVGGQGMVLDKGVGALLEVNGGHSAGGGTKMYRAPEGSGGAGGYLCSIF